MREEFLLGLSMPEGDQEFSKSKKHGEIREYIRRRYKIHAYLYAEDLKKSQMVKTLRTI